MALTNQPFIPFYVGDWMNSTKLKECSPGAHGLMICIMCVMHKSENYGTILLKQKYKQPEKQDVKHDTKQVQKFARQLVRQTAFDFAEILPFLIELLEENVLIVEGDLLICPRMVKDANLSRIRALSGKKGGEIAQQKKKVVAKDFAQAKFDTSTENENEYVNENENVFKEGLLREKFLLPDNIREVVEMNQFTHTKNSNSEYVLAQWEVFLAERNTDPPLKQMRYRSLSDLTEYFINWMRKKFPEKNGTHSKNLNDKPSGTSTKRTDALRNW